MAERWNDGPRNGGGALVIFSSAKSLLLHMTLDYFFKVEFFVVKCWKQGGATSKSEFHEKK